MKRILAAINLVILFFLTTINFIFLFEISKDKELGNFYFKNIELSEEYLDIEISHMNEVRDLVNKSLFVNVVSLILFLFIDNYKQKNFKFVGIGLLTLAVLFIISSLFFEAFFNQWHEFVFVSDNWLLPANAKLIQDYPLDYFENKFLLLDSMLAFFGILMLILDKNKLSSLIHIQKEE